MTRGAGHSKGADSVITYAAKYDDVPRVVNVSGRFHMDKGGSCPHHRQGELMGVGKGGRVVSPAPLSPLFRGACWCTVHLAMCKAYKNLMQTNQWALWTRICIAIIMIVLRQSFMTRQ